jgi:hypothetical protein
MFEVPRSYQKNDRISSLSFHVQISCGSKQRQRRLDRERLKWTRRIDAVFCRSVDVDDDDEDDYDDNDEDRRGYSGKGVGQGLQPSRILE